MRCPTIEITAFSDGFSIETRVRASGAVFFLTSGPDGAHFGVDTKETRAEAEATVENWRAWLRAQANVRN